MNISIVLVHNKSDEENNAQIDALLALVEKQTESNQISSENGDIETYETYYYTLKGIEGHQVKFYQILPYQPNNLRLVEGKPYEGVWPVNASLLDSHKVAYGQGDEDKQGDHPRFFNWGLKRATDYGADIVIHLKDYKKFDVQGIVKSIEKKEKRQDKAYGKISRKDDLQITE